MAELIPYPFGALVDRMFRELEAQESIFDLPKRKFFLGSSARDFSVRFHGHRASSPLGPAAGPQSQMAQNMVLAWLTGSRIMELKTVQIMDELEIPRPCIDLQTIGYNVEWSQELKLEQSLHEYVKGAMLIEILRASGVLDIAPGFDQVIYDMSVGYDLAGIQSEPVQRFIRGMMDASEVVAHYRAQIPDRYREYRDLDFQTKLSDTLTLSTFHGCPPDEIERIIDFLLKEVGLNCIIKLNPTLLGPERVRELVTDVMGYTDVHVPPAAFEKDTRWEQAQAFVTRLGDTADALGLGLGVKFTNTLIVENHRDFFPEEEKEMYLSGQPLHVLAMNLVARFRETFGDRFPISFSAGIDRGNFADAVSLGLVPVTVCSDLLRPGGYGRASAYFAQLDRRMDAVGATTVDDFILLAHGQAEAALAKLDLAADDPTHRRCLDALEKGGDLRVAAEANYDAWVSHAKLLNTAAVVPRLTADPRYALAKNSKAPRKIGSVLELFDCITCDKCIPVCPNNANFRLVIPPTELSILKVQREESGWKSVETGSLPLEMKHQIANFADFCNECGNCDIFCPEDGGPYVLKPRFFGDVSSFEEFSTLDGFAVARRGDTDTIHARFDGQEFLVQRTQGRVEYRGDGFAVSFDRDAPLDTLAGSAEGLVDLTYYFIVEQVVHAVLDTGHVNYISALPQT